MKCFEKGDKVIISNTASIKHGMIGYVIRVSSDDKEVTIESSNVPRWGARGARRFTTYAEWVDFYIEEDDEEIVANDISLIL